MLEIVMEVGKDEYSSQHILEKLPPGHPGDSRLERCNGISGVKNVAKLLECWIGYVCFLRKPCAVTSRVLKILSDECRKNLLLKVSALVQIV